MVRILSILLSAVLLAGCVSAPVTLIVTDRETGKLLEGIRANVFHAAFFDLVPSGENGITDSNGEVTLRFKRHRGRGPTVRLSKHNQERYSSLLHTSGDFIDRAKDHHKDTNRPLKLHVPIVSEIKLPRCEFLVELPDAYKGPVGMILRQDPDTYQGFVGAVEVRIVVDGKVVVHSMTRVDEPCFDMWDTRMVYENGSSIILWQRRDTNDLAPTAFHLHNRGGGSFREIEPGVRQQIRSGGERQTVFFVGSRARFDEYRSAIGGSSKSVSAELDRICGPVPSHWRHGY